MIVLIGAMSENRVIGNKNKIPWLEQHPGSGDLSFFKKITTNHKIVMGRKTYESIGHALPNRDNIVLTTDSNWKASDASVVHTKQDILSSDITDEPTFIIGGSQLYNLFLEDADIVYLTVMHCRVEGDSFFPALDPKDWSIQEVKSYVPSIAYIQSSNQSSYKLGYTIYKYTRK